MLLTQRGARNLVYLSRGGDSNKAAKEHVRNLEESGINVIVIKGDVSVMADVEAAIEAAPSPIEGVVQAAMSLDVRSPGPMASTILIDWI